MPPNNTNSHKSAEIDFGLELQDRPAVVKCVSKKEPLVNGAKMQMNGVGISRSQSNVNVEGNKVWVEPQKNRSVCSLVDELLCDIYSKMEVKRRTSATTCDISWQDSDPGKESRNEIRSFFYWKTKDKNSLLVEKSKLEKLIAEEGIKLVKHLKRKNFLLMKREAHYDVITAYIQAVSMKTREDTKMKFTLSPGTETGFSQWLDAMKMVAQLPGGMPPEFRTKLWLQLSEKHLHDQNVDWEKAEAVIFNEWANPDDEELGVQIVKDLHRTGCSLFCGEQEHNQALLKRVLLAYARWNKNVGYCQGFNMLAALILQVMDKDEKNAVKVMIYLIEGVLPESYFANNLRGLSVDMAVFRDLLRLRLPKLSKHLEALQHDTNAGTSYEPPLTNVFTMQWFLTLFSNCLPQQTVLRVWDLVFLYGNEVLLRTALAIWGILQDRVITVNSADEFYSIMGVVTREMLEFGLMDANTLVKMIAMVDPFPNELQELRDKYLYNISPWTQSVQTAAKKGIRLFYGDPDDQDDTEDEDKIALATAYGVFRRRESTGRELQLSGPTLDISVLKQQYSKLRQRQRQAHVIITAACSSTLAGNLTSGPSVSVNHLLMGKSALINKGRRIGPPEGAIPPPNNKKAEMKKPKIIISGETFDWKDAEKTKTKKIQNKPHKRDVFYENERNRIGIGNEKNELNTNHDRMEENTENEYQIDREADSDTSSTSTELCDDEFHRISDFDSEDNSDSYNFRETSPRPTRPQPTTPESFLKLAANSPEPKYPENGGCDKDNLKEIKNCAVSLLNEIEGKVQTLSKLKNLNLKNETPGMPVVDKFDNTSQVISLTKKHLDDNILKQEPEVPIRNFSVEIQKEPETAENERDKVRRKSDLGLNVIRENLEMLQKFSHKTTEKMGRSFEIEIIPEPEVKKSSSFEKDSFKIPFSQLDLPLKEQEVQKLPKTESQESLRLGSSLFVEKAISPIAEKMSYKVNKEVNTEITFGMNEIKMPITKTKLGLQDENEKFSVTRLSPTQETQFRFLKEPKRYSRKEVSPVQDTSRKSRETFMRDREKDEIKKKLENSKSDWELKMKRIAELETTTRETLNEIQARSMNRKSLHRSLDRTPRRINIDSINMEGDTLPEIKQESNTRKSKLSALSFDEITSRTEKLLGKGEAISDEDWKKNKNTQEYSFDTKDFLSSPSSPENRSRKKYLDYSPKNYSEVDLLDKGKKYEDELLRVTQNGSRTSVDSIKKYSPERKKEGEFEPLSKTNFNPFPKRTSSRPKELGVKLGLYPTSPEAQSKKS